MQTLEASLKRGHYRREGRSLPSVRGRKKPAGAAAPAGPSQIQILSSALFDFRGLRSFGSLHYFKFDRITLLQRPVAVTGNCRVVYEYIGTVFTAYESVSFRIVKPLHCSSHFVSP